MCSRSFCLADEYEFRFGSILSFDHLIHLTDRFTLDLQGYEYFLQLIRGVLVKLARTSVRVDSPFAFRLSTISLADPCFA